MAPEAHGSPYSRHLSTLPLLHFGSAFVVVMIALLFVSLEYSAFWAPAIDFDAPLIDILSLSDLSLTIVIYFDPCLSDIVRESFHLVIL